MNDRPKIVLGEDDFAAEPQQVQQAAAPTLPAPPASGSSPPSGLPPVARREPLNVGSLGGGHPAGGASYGGGTNIMTNARLGPLIAAAIGVFAGWALGELSGVFSMTPSSKAAAHAVTGLWTGIVGVAVGGALLTFDRAVAGAWESAGKRFAQAAIPMFVVCFISGFAANALFTTLVEQIIANGDFQFEGNPQIYLARAIGWALFGAGIGVTIGLADKSNKRAINGAVGGAIGGAIGGLIFQFVAEQLQTSLPMSRLIGLLAIGILIALATRLVETARRDAWLHVLQGGMSGKEFILYHQVTRIGASPECEIFLLKDPAIDKFHARIDDHGTQRNLIATSDAPVYVNQAPISTHTLRHGDQLQFGQTVIGYSERASGT